MIRLGTLRSNLVVAEPFLRDAHLVSMDISAVKQSEAPGTRFSSPNGLLAEEACQLARYAGLSEQVSCFGIFEVNPKYDNHDQTAHLAAQAAGISWRDLPSEKVRFPHKQTPILRFSW